MVRASFFGLQQQRHSHFYTQEEVTLEEFIDIALSEDASISLYKNPIRRHEFYTQIYLAEGIPIWEWPDFKELEEIQFKLPIKGKEPFVFTVPKSILTREEWINAEEILVAAVMTDEGIIWEVGTSFNPRTEACCPHVWCGIARIENWKLPYNLKSGLLRKCLEKRAEVAKKSFASGKEAVAKASPIVLAFAKATEQLSC